MKWWGEVHTIAEVKKSYFSEKQLLTNASVVCIINQCVKLTTVELFLRNILHRSRYVSEFI